MADNSDKFVDRIGRSDTAAGITRIATVSISTAAPIIFAVVAWLLVYVISGIDKAIDSITTNAQALQVAELALDKRVLAIETDRALRIQDYGFKVQELNTRFGDMTSRFNDIDKSINTLSISVTTALTELHLKVEHDAISKSP